MKRYDITQTFANMNAGCSSMGWKTKDQKHLWGRNFDFNRFVQGSKVTYAPKGKMLYGCVTEVNGNVMNDSEFESLYGAVGMGSLLIPSTPVLYEGINEKGLMGGQLYYRKFAHFASEAVPGTLPLQAGFAVTYFLTRCASVEEVVEAIRSKITVIDMPMLGTVPTIHWSFSDSTGEVLIIEPDETGISIYRNTMGVMTNSPSYSWHRLNLLNYFNVRNLDYDVLDINDERLDQCFSGNGAHGLPGDCSSPSRFIRLSFLKKYGIEGENEEEGIVYLFHLFQNVAFPLGMVEVSQDKGEEEYNTEIVPFDYTLYTSAMCAESLRYYWISYENQRIQCVDLNDLLKHTEYVQYDLRRVPDIKYLR